MTSFMIYGEVNGSRESGEVLAPDFGSAVEAFIERFLELGYAPERVKVYVVKSMAALNPYTVK